VRANTLVFVFASMALPEIVFAQPKSGTAPAGHRLYATILDRSGLSYSFFFQETARADGTASGTVTVRTHLADGRPRDELLLFTANCRQQSDPPPEVRYSRPNSSDSQVLVTLDPKKLKSSDDVQEPLNLWLAVCYEGALSPQGRSTEQQPRDKPDPMGKQETTLPSTSSPSPKLAALPADKSLQRFDGKWTINWSNTTGCKIPGGTYSITIANGGVTGIRKAGSVSAAGSISWRSINHSGKPVAYRGRLHNDSGSGKFQNLELQHCAGAFTATRTTGR
jgi:hypothetical protein